MSPLLANIYLHYVLDEWFGAEVQPRLRGPSRLVRYCDDFVMLFASKIDAQRVLSVLGKRLGRYGLQLHPQKTRLVAFRFPDRTHQRGEEQALATTFNFLGFTHVWGRSRKGNPVVLQLTAKDRFARTLHAIDRQCRSMRHSPIRDQHSRLSPMLKGHFAYFGITGNHRRLAALCHQAERLWRKWLSRRSNQSGLAWAAFGRVLQHLPLPTPRIVHCYTGA